jgi:hypothetical protein
LLGRASWLAGAEVGSFAVGLAMGGVVACAVYMYLYAGECSLCRGAVEVSVCMCWGVAAAGGGAEEVK